MYIKKEQNYDQMNNRVNPIKGERNKIKVEINEIEKNVIIEEVSKFKSVFFGSPLAKWTNCWQDGLREER